MKMMFNGLNRPFELSNLRYGYEAREILYFVKYHSITIYIYMSNFISITEDIIIVMLRFPLISLVAKLHIGKERGLLKKNISKYTFKNNTYHKRNYKNILQFYIIIKIYLNPQYSKIYLDNYTSNIK
jgi:hypothetical protein